MQLLIQEVMQQMLQLVVSETRRQSASQTLRSVGSKLVWVKLRIITWPCCLKCVGGKHSLNMIREV